MTSEQVDNLHLIVGRRWTAWILMAMLDHDRPMRFGELLASVQGLSKRLLTDRLIELEAADLVRRDVRPDRPVTITYALTERGASLRPALDALRTWNAQNSA